MQVVVIYVLIRLARVLFNYFLITIKGVFCHKLKTMALLSCRPKDIFYTGSGNLKTTPADRGLNQDVAGIVDYDAL